MGRWGRLILWREGDSDWLRAGGVVRGGYTPSSECVVLWGPERLVGYKEASTVLLKKRKRKEKRKKKKEPKKKIKVAEVQHNQVISEVTKK